MTEKQNLSADLESKILKRLPIETLIIAGFMAIIISIIFDTLSALLCFAGGLVSCLTFLWLKKLIPHHLSSQQGLKPGRLLGFQFLRLGLIGLFFLIIIYFFSTRALAFMAGLVASVLAIGGEAIFSLRKRKWKA